MTGEVFNINDPEIPLVTLITVDNTYTRGATGLLISDLIIRENGSADATFDNYKITPIPLPAGIVLFVSGLSGLFRYKIQ